MLFTPKKTKYKKKQKGKRLNTINKLLSLRKFSFGKVALLSLDCGHLTSKQISTLRQTVNKVIKKKGKLKINIFPNTQISKKPLEVRMGKGKGNIDRWIFKVRASTVLCEVQAPSITLGIKALRLAQYKMPINTRIIINR